MNIGNILGSLLGNAIGLGINQAFNPISSLNVDGQINQLQNMLNSNMANQMAMLSQYMLGAQNNAGAAANGTPNMFNGLSSFYGTIPGIPAVQSTSGTTTANQGAYSVNALEMSSSLSAVPEDKTKIVEGLVESSINDGIDPSLKAELTKKLMEDLKDVPVEALEMLKKNGTKIKFVSKDTSMADLGVIGSIDKKDALTQQSSIIEKLNAQKESNGFKFVDPEVLKQNETDQNKTGPKGLNTFKDQFIEELTSIYYEGKTPTDQEVADFKDAMVKTHNDKVATKEFTEAWKKKKESLSNDPAKLARIDKILALEDMLGQAQTVPVKHMDKYYKTEDYGVISAWDQGSIESMYHKTQKVIYLKEEVIGRPLDKQNYEKIAVHEVSHALENAISSLAPEFGTKLRAKVEENYSTNQQSDADPLYVDPNGKNEFVSLYASASPDEYFAETFASYFSSEKMQTLKDNDPKQYNLITELFKELTQAKQMAMSGGLTAKSA